MAQEIGKANMVFTAQSAQLRNEVGKINKSLLSISDAARSVKNYLLATFGAYAVVGKIQEAVMTLAEFDKTMTQVGVITGSTGEDFDRLRNSALQLGSATQYTAKQVAELQLEYGRLGFSTREILQSTQATVDLATATGEGLARSAEIAGSTLRAFNLDASEMGRVTDVMAASMNESALTLDSFAEGIKYVAPVAAATNVSLEETAAMLSVLADAGIKGSQAGTSLRRIFTMLTDGGKPLQQRLDELAKSGITLAVANDEVGLYAQTALLVLTKYKPKIDELTEAYKAAIGETNAMARAMEDNLGTAITKVGTAYDALILSFSKSKGFLRETADALSMLLRIGASDGLSGMAAQMGQIALNPIMGFVSLQKRSLEIAEEYAKLEKKQSERDRIIDDSAIVLLRDYGDNLDGVRTALLDNADAEAIYIRYLDLAKQSQIDQAKAIITNTLAQEENNKEKEKALKLAYEQSELERGARIATLDRLQNGQDYSGLFKNFVPFDLGGTTKSSDLIKSGIVDTSQIENIKGMNEALMNLSNTTAEFGLNLDFAGTQQAKWESLAQSIEKVGDSITRVITADESLGKSIAAVSANIIEELERQALAAIIRNAAISAKNPIAAVIAATVGFSVIKGLFAKISKGKNGESSSNVGQYSRVSPYGGMNVSFRQRGTDLVGVGVEENRVRARTRG